jgi:xylulose-5-phosphate/fructose-6-phosphate phosphoketolase
VLTYVVSYTHGKQMQADHRTDNWNLAEPLDYEIDDGTKINSFTRDRPIIFDYHGYPWLIHRLTYRRANQQLHVRGYKEEGTTTTPFDMCVLNEIDRFHLAMDVIDRVPRLENISAHLRQQLRNKLTDHTRYIRAHGEDMPEVVNWKWPAE